MSTRWAYCLAAAAGLSVYLILTTPAHSITVRPATMDHIEASVPAEVMAGEEFLVPITFVDRFGNDMPPGWKPVTSLSLTLSQPASVQPSVLTGENYERGFRFRVYTERMGNLTLSLVDEAGKVLKSWELTIRSGKPAKILVDAPRKAEAGDEVVLSLRAVDMHGNTVFGYLPEGDSLLLESPGASMAGPVRDRGRGVFELPVTFQVPGQHALDVRDRKRGLSGTSTTITVSPAPLASFEVTTSTPKVRAGEEINLVIRARDKYGNTLSDYDSRYKGVRLFTPEAAISPDLIPPASFKDGVARTAVTLKSAGIHGVRLSELQSNVSGNFEVQVLPSTVKTLKVQTPESAVAGEPFQVTVRLEDAFGNTVPSPPRGSIIRLKATGTGVLEPDRVAGESFRDGAAQLMVRYEKAESFEIRALLEGGGDAPSSAMAAAPSSGDGKEAARQRAEKAREEALRARRESRLRQSRSAEASVPPPATPAPSKVPPQPAAREKPVPPPEPKTRPAAPPADAPPPVVASKKPLRPGILDEVAVSEEDGKARVTFATNGMTDYTVTTSAKLSRKWIDIDFPNVGADLPDRIRGGEKIIGEVYVQQPAPNGQGVRVSVEILSVRIGYNVFQEGDSIVLKVTAQ